MLIVRPPNPTDLWFIHDSWLKSYWKSGHAPVKDWPTYFEGQAKRIDRLLVLSETRIACFDSSPDEIVGYAVVQGECVHWLYVKKDYRRHGAARVLAHNCTVHSVRTGVGDKVAKALNLKYNPYRLDVGV